MKRQAEDAIPPAATTPLPPGWSWAKVAEVGEVKLGRQRSPEHHTGMHMRPYLRVANVYEDRIDLSDVLSMNFTPEEYETYHLKFGDILLNEGQSLEWVGRPAMYRDELPGACFQNTLVRFRPRECVTSKFALLVFRYYLHSRRFQKIARWTVNIAHLGAARFSDVEFPIPPLAEQERIVAKVEELFSELDAGVAVLEKVRAKLKRYRASVLKAAVEGRLTEKWRAEHPPAEPAPALLARILADRRRRWEEAQKEKFATAKKSPPKDWQSKYAEMTPPDTATLPSLPDGWCWAAALQVCERVENGNTPPPAQMTQGSGEVPFIKVYNLTHTGHLNFDHKPTFISTETHRNLLGRSVVRPGDVLMNIVGPPLGKVSLVPDTFPEWNTNQAVVLFRTLPGVSNHYLKYCLLAEPVIQWITSQAKATAGQHNISVSMSRALPIPIAPLDEQAAVVEEIERRLTVVDKLAAQVENNLKRAARLRQGILKRAFEGKLVSQDPADEPATALLARLQPATSSISRGRRP